MISVLRKTMVSLRPTFITIISIIATAKVMGYSSMTTTIADHTVAATGLMYPAIAIGAPLNTQIWIAAANATGACAGKLIAPQSIAIGVAAIGVAGRGSESHLLTLTMKVYLPFIVMLGMLVYFGGSFL